MDPSRSYASRVGCWLPRLRGDGPAGGPAAGRAHEAPPPTRGWTRSCLPYWICISGSPAYAGMDPDAATGRSAPARLPRLRGDGPLDLALFTTAEVAPPPTRGWTRQEAHRAGARLGSPAYAGMDPTTARPRRSTRWLPRLRGDGPAVTAPPALRPSAPPPTRGWTLRQHDGLWLASGSPAYAGMDPEQPRPRAGIERLPRLRGDGPWT